MTILDLAAAAIVVLGSIFGAISGAIAQLVRVGATAAAIAAPVFFAGPLAVRLQPRWDLPYALTYALTAVGLGLGAYVVVRLFTLPARAWIRRRESLVGWDQAAGALMGAAKASVFAWIVLSLLALVAGPLEEKRARPAALRGALLELAGETNAVALLLSSRQQVVKDALTKFRGNTGAPPDPRFRRLLDNERMRRAVVGGAPDAIAQSEDLLRLVTDGEAIRQLRRALAGAEAAKDLPATLGAKQE